MKRLWAVLLIFVMLFGITSCGKVYTDKEKYESKVAEEQSKSEKKESERNSAIAEDKEKLESQLGKSERDKKIVVKLLYGDHIEYEEVLFNKKGVSTEKYIYKYFDTDRYYEMVLGYGDDGNRALVDHDDKTRMIKYRIKDFTPSDYDTLLAIYQRRDPETCQIIEE